MPAFEGGKTRTRTGGPQAQELPVPQPGLSKSGLYHVMNSHLFHLLLCMAICAQLILAAMEADLGVKKQSIPWWNIVGSNLILVFYAVETSLRVYVEWESYTRTWHNVFDAAVVALDLIVEITGWVFSREFPSIAVLRVFRLLRLARIFQFVSGLYHLRLIIDCLQGALLASLWASTLMFFLLTICSIVAVQFIQPIVASMSDHNLFGGCSRCAVAFESVMTTNLTWLQTIVMGDSWGSYFLPIMEHHPYTAFLILPVCLLVSMVLMNVLLTVIVDEANVAREKAEKAREAIAHEEIKSHLEISKKMLSDYFMDLDKDQSGLVTLEELTCDSAENAHFKHSLESFGIQEHELGMVFEAMDSDGSGSVTHQEFVDNLYKVMTTDDHCMLVGIHHSISFLMKKVVNEVGKLRQDLKAHMEFTHSVLPKSSLQNTAGGVILMQDGIACGVAAPVPQRANKAPSTPAFTPKPSFSTFGSDGKQRRDDQSNGSSLTALTRLEADVAQLQSLEILTTSMCNLAVKVDKQVAAVDELAMRIDGSVFFLQDGKDFASAQLNPPKNVPQPPVRVLGSESRSDPDVIRGMKDAATTGCCKAQGPPVVRRV